MPNLVESTKEKLLRAESYDLTSEEFAIVTATNLSSKELFAIHDRVFGGNLSKIPHHHLLDGPFVPPNNEPDIIPNENGDGGEFVLAVTHTY